MKMNHILKFITVIIVLHIVFSCKTEKNSLAGSHDSDYIATRTIFDSIMYQEFKDMAYKTDNVKLFMEEPNERSFKIVYRKMRSGLFDIMPNAMTSDTLFILDVSSDIGATIMSLFWNKRDTCVRYEELEWRKDKINLSKMNLKRMQIISAWDTTMLQKMDSMSCLLRRKGIWERKPELLYTASRIVFKCGRRNSNYFVFHDWPEAFENDFRVRANVMDADRKEYTEGKIIDKTK